MKDEKLKQVFKEIVEMNKTLLQRRGGFTPTCFLIDENYNYSTMIIMHFDSSDGKIAMRNKLKKFIAERKIKGYIIAMDAKMTIIDKKKEPKFEKVVDTLIHTLFAPQENIIHSAIYNKQRKFIEEFEEENIASSDWNVWNTLPYDAELEKEYHQFKEDNPDKYKNVL